MLQPQPRASVCFPCPPGTVCLDREWVKVAARCLEHCISSTCVRRSKHPSSSLSPGPRLSISCHLPAHQQRVHITRLSAKQLMRLGSRLSIIFVSLRRSGNILVQRNKETWATMARSQAFTPVHENKILTSTDHASPPNDVGVRGGQKED